MNIASLLGIVEQIMPEAIALADETETVTYGELFVRGRELRSALEARNGSLAGKTVSTVQTVSTTHVATVLGALMGGAHVNVLNYRLRAQELVSLTDEVDPQTVAVDARYLSLFSDRPGRAWQPVAGPAAVDADDPVHMDDDESAITLFTSGTTGRPKLIQLSHGSLTTYLLNTFLPADGTPRGRTLVTTPSYHVAGLSTLLGSIYAGRTIALMGDFDAGGWLRRVEGVRPDHAFLVPTMMRRILDHPDFARTDLTSLDLVSYGSDTMPRPTITEALTRFPSTTRFVNAYGLTEAGGTVSVLGADDHEAARTLTSEMAVVRLGSIGRSVPGVDIRIHGTGEQALPARELGEVVVRREGQAAWLETGDLGYLDEDGYLFLAGRTVDRIVRAGENIDPLEIEASILRMDDVSEVAVYGVPDLEWGEAVAAVVVRRPGAECGADDIRRAVRRELASFKVPRDVYFVGEIPRNSMGKVVRSKLEAHLVGMASG